MAFRGLLVVLFGSASLLLGGEPFEGIAQPHRQAELGAPVSSRIIELKVKEGDAVKAGQPLAQFYAAFEELEMQRAKAQLERREFEAKGARRLLDSKVIPEARAMESRLELEMARLQYETAAEQVRLRQLTAPFDGRVVVLHKEVGESLSTAQPVLRLVDLSRMNIPIFVPPGKLSAFRKEQKVKAWFPQLPGSPIYEGIVTLIDSLPDAQGRYRVQISVENPDGLLRSGLKALVEIP